jgi:hypothetical protein
MAEFSWRGPFQKIEDATTCPGGYALDLYCDHIAPWHEHNGFPHTFHSETGSNARKQARRTGWKLHDDGTATCPRCAKEKRNAR